MQFTGRSGLFCLHWHLYDPLSAGPENVSREMLEVYLHPSQRQYAKFTAGTREYSCSCHTHSGPQTRYCQTIIFTKQKIFNSEITVSEIYEELLK